MCIRDRDRAPWRGFKDQVKLAMELENTLELNHFVQLVHAGCISRNRFVDRSGYTIEQRVFGENLRESRTGQIS
eukprot:3858202-Amphidinium_carterae.1